VDIDETAHLRGLHGKGGVKTPTGELRGRWNPQWRRFAADNPNASPLQIYQFAGQMLDENGLGGLPIHRWQP
jgi:hypothetical protein